MFITASALLAVRSIYKGYLVKASAASIVTGMPSTQRDVAYVQHYPYLTVEDPFICDVHMVFACFHWLNGSMVS